MGEGCEGLKLGALNLKEEGRESKKAGKIEEKWKTLFFGEARAHRADRHDRAVSFSQPSSRTSILARSNRAIRHAHAKNCRREKKFLLLIRSTGPVHRSTWTGPRTEFTILMDRGPDRFVPVWSGRSAVRSGFGPNNFQPYKQWSLMVER